jgi:hypothetical protein
MLLLSFKVQNHKSLRDEVTLSFQRPSLRTLTPRAGTTWEESVHTIAGIFGGNATGKSTVLDALWYMFAAIEQSSTSWQARRHMTRAPFLLDGVSQDLISRYEMEFVSSGTRYLYGFEVDGKGFSREWLKDVPGIRWRTLIDRDRHREGEELRPHALVRSLGPVTDRELALSRARVVGHDLLAPLANDLVDSFDHVTVKDTHRERRLAAIADSLMDDTITIDDIVTLLRVADIGVEDLAVQEDALPTRVREALASFREALESNGNAVDLIALRTGPKGQQKEDPPTEPLDDEESDAVVRNLLFRHQGKAETPPTFSVNAESDGTIAWLALMVPAIEVLRYGGIYCVDEIDSSLHPHLLDVVLGVFADPDLNRHGAQLIFTSHETYLLSPLSEVPLEPEQVWFADKSVEGATTLTSLSAFPRHKDANVAKRYLLGRYGGTPRLAPGALAALLDERD